MGDLVGVAVSGTLYHVPLKEFDRVRGLDLPTVTRTELFAALARINTLYMIARAGSGHIGSSFSSMEVMSWMQLNEVHAPGEGARNIFFSSKGHDAPALYSVLIGAGLLPYDLIHRLRRHGGLPGHPDIGTPNMVTNTGSLGMGVSKAKGMLFANRLLDRKGRVFVLTGDGELQEGQFWESLISAANHKLSNLTVIIDHNKLQSDTLVAKVSDLGDLPAKLAAFGWHVGRCDGNDLAALSRALEVAKAADGPSVIIADTIKGKGVSFMEHTSIDSDVEYYKFHSGAPTADAYVRAVQELIDGANARLAAANAEPLELDTVNRPAVAQPEIQQRLIPAYTEALLDQARRNPKIVALDADLVLDTGLIPFQKEFPERFVECGIAEQDMVSQAGTMALGGLRPVVHSFACFLTTRASEQIYNNATERSKIVYVGSLAGLLPAGPGHSHQSVRDVTAMSAMPDLVALEPMSGSQVQAVLAWALNEHTHSSYIRLTSIPLSPRPELDSLGTIRVGQGHVLREGTSGTAIVATNPVLLIQALEAADLLAKDGVETTVIGTPWLNRFDAAWFEEVLAGHARVFTLENHYIENGFGTMFVTALAQAGLLDGRQVETLGLTEIPTFGSNDEVLAHHRLDAASLATALR